MLGEVGLGDCWRDMGLRQNISVKVSHRHLEWQGTEGQGADPRVKAGAGRHMWMQKELRSQERSWRQKPS